MTVAIILHASKPDIIIYTTGSSENASFTSIKVIIIAVCMHLSKDL